MSIHSHTRCWLHYVWGTLRKEVAFDSGSARELENYLYRYAEQRGIRIQATAVNPDHIHVLLDLPAIFTVEKAGKLLKGASSYWINKHRVVEKKFAWEKGYTVFSVSQTMVPQVTQYFADQKEFHQKVTYREEYARLLRNHGLDDNGWKGIR